MNTTETKKSKRFVSLLIILLCVALCAGATYAYFTDTAENNNNKIQAGNLKIDLQAWDSRNGWYSIADETDPVFTKNLWEPGYTDVKLFRVVNQGDLAIEWEARLESKYEMGKLAKVIDVYVLTSDQEISYPQDREAFSAWGEPRGNLYELFDNFPELIHGELKAKDDCAYFGIAFRMRADADNDYRNLELGEFDIAIYATQLNHESDAFGPEYDEDADLPESDPTKYAKLIYTLSEDEQYYIVSGLETTEGELNIEIPEYYKGLPVKEIGEKAFFVYREEMSEEVYDGCHIKSIIFPAQLERIGDMAFNSCVMDELTVPAGVEIGEMAFVHATIGELTILDGIESVGLGAFYGLKSDSITLPSTLKSLSQQAFYECRIKEVIIPEGVESIGFSAFAESYVIERVVLPKSVKTIDIGAFGVCQNLAEVVIPTDSLLTNIGSNAFADCDSLTYIYIPEGVEEIEQYTFAGSNLQSVVLPSNLKRIGECAFASCDMMQIIIPASVEYIDYDAFNYCRRLIEVYNLSSLPIYAGSEEHGGVAYYADVVHTSISSPSCLFTGQNGYIFYANGSTCYLMGYVGSETDLVFPQDCNGYSYEIYMDAFRFREDITSITLSNGITGIGSDAFYYCTGLTSLTIPASVIYIGDYAFSSCENLITVTFENNCQLQTIGESAFSSSGLTSFIVPNTVTGIGSCAFEWCTSLKTVIIPSNVTYMGYDVFYYCEGAMIFCEVSSDNIPYDWDPNWYGYRVTVVWGWTGEEYTYTFVTNNGSTISSITSSIAIELPKLPHGDAYFTGWLDSQGNEVDSPYFSQTEHTLYARWMSEEEYLIWCDGTSFKKAMTAVEGTQTVRSHDYYQYLYYIFTPDETHLYKFMAYGGYYQEAWIYNSDLQQMEYREISDGEFISITLVAGETYYLKVRDGDGMSFNLTIIKETSLEEYFAQAIPVSLNNEYTAEITTVGLEVCFAFTPETNGTYTFESIGDSNTYACLYDAEQTLLDSDSYSGVDDNFSISRELIAGNTYYLMVRFNWELRTGSFPVIVK